MGCCISNKLNESVYENPRFKKCNTEGHVSPTSAGSKRTYRSRRSSKSSGIYSHCSSPSPSSCPSTPKFYNDKRSAPQTELSYGYHSEKFEDISLSSSNKSKQTSVELCRTQDVSDSSKNATPPSYSDYGMELYMMTNSKNVMSNTSTPIVRRKNESYTLNESAVALPAPSKNYLLWKKMLKERPTSMIHDVSHIPEALSGNSCPAYFPAYTYNRTVESRSMCAKPNATYILSTDL